MPERTDRTLKKVAAGGDQHLRTLEALSVGGRIAVAAGLLAAVLGFSQGLEAGGPLGGGTSLAAALIAAMPGIVIAMLGAILAAVSYTGWSSRKTHLALQETLTALRDSSAVNYVAGRTARR